ncbi:Aste57867_20194 [Aphanomyces stellatus]|uniref:Aste57867_20194 protein n=1 Tax=Aphanomyces stellatus TaxID=120398 RepID=A0A485LF13_9STRA|nr:hypothetical protein As57867_020128 [Aphanomyces stellatus]VFT96888.1 Aste57867_20194 [Aphanomyces stellatus]
MTPPFSHSDELLLDEDQYRTWKYQLRETVIQAMQSSPATREYDAVFEGYKLTTDKHLNTRVFKRKAKQYRRSAFCEVLSVSTCDLSLEDIAYTFYNSSSASHRSHLAMVHNDKFLDGEILNTTLTKCEEDPFQWFGVKYLKVNFQSSDVFGPRDAAYFEYSGTTADREGQKVLFVVRESCHLPEVPRVPSAVRFEFKEWFLFTQLHDGSVESVHYYHAEPKGNYPPFLFNSQAVRIGQTSEDIPHHFRQKWLLEQAPPHMSIHDTARFCGSCSTTLKATGKASRHQCRACGQAVCGKCVMYATEAQPACASLSITKVAFCKKCYVVASQLSSKRVIKRIRLLDSDSLRGDRVSNELPHFRDNGTHVSGSTATSFSYVSPSTVANPASVKSRAKERESNITSRSTIQSEDVCSSYEPSLMSDSEDEDLTASFIKVNQGLEAQKALMNQMQRQMNQSTAARRSTASSIGECV